MNILSDLELLVLLRDLRQQKEELQAKLRDAVAEFDRRSALADMQRRYSPKLLARVISGAGGINSAEAVGRPGA